MFAPLKSPLVLDPNKPPAVLVEGVDMPACAEADCPKGVGGLLAKRLPGAGADPNSPPLEAPDVAPDPNNPDPPEPPAPDPNNPPPWLLDITVALLINVCRFGVLVFRTGKQPFRRLRYAIAVCG